MMNKFRIYFIPLLLLLSCTRPCSTPNHVDYKKVFSSYYGIAIDSVDAEYLFYDTIVVSELGFHCVKFRKKNEIGGNVSGKIIFDSCQNNSYVLRSAYPRAVDFLSNRNDSMSIFQIGNRYQFNNGLDICINLLPIALRKEITPRILKRLLRWDLELDRPSMLGDSAVTISTQRQIDSLIKEFKGSSLNYMNSKDSARNLADKRIDLFRTFLINNLGQENIFIYSRSIHMEAAVIEKYYAPRDTDKVDPFYEVELYALNIW